MRHHNTHLGLLAATALVVGCSSSNDVTDVGPTGELCTLEARAGITLDVRDSVSNAQVGRNASIIAREGAVADTSHETSIGDGPFGLVYERAGTYTVTVEQTGYKVWTRAGVLVTRDVCHVKGVALTARLQR